MQSGKLSLMNIVKTLNIKASLHEILSSIFAMKKFENSSQVVSFEIILYTFTHIFYTLKFIIYIA